MKSEKTWQEKAACYLFYFGILAVLFMVCPYLILGQDAIFVYHDQLDGELIAYLLQAKHLFQGNIIPEFMNGAYKTALVPPAPMWVLFFAWSDGFAGLVCMQLVGSLVGYIGMYLLIQYAAGSLMFKDNKLLVTIIAVVLAIMYAYLPFLPVYGLSQYGLPLLLWCVLQVQYGKYVKIAYLYGAVYALTSSLVLAGFGVLGVLAVWALWCGIECGYMRSRNDVTKKYPRYIWGLLIFMSFFYVIENWTLLKQIMGLGEFENYFSHKVEYVLQSVGFWEDFIQKFTHGVQHGADYHEYFLPVVLVVVIVGFLCRANGKLVKMIGLALECILCFALFAALWNSGMGVLLRSELSALGAFQVERLLWMAPCLWYLVLGCSLFLTMDIYKAVQGKKRLWGIFCGAALLVVVCVTGVKVLLGSNLKPNVQKMRNPEYTALSFNDYYAVGVLEQVERFIYENEGKEQNEYRVVSLGIDPAAALYHGFYCLDGYSNNYSLEYKNAFRRIIAPELERSEYLANTFDTWGNRCYLFSAETPGYYTIEKGGFFFRDYRLDREALKDMGGQYILSAAYIQNAEEIGITLLNAEPFGTEDSYYQIYLYKVG